MVFYDLYTLQSIYIIAKLTPIEKAYSKLLLLSVQYLYFLFIPSFPFSYIFLSMFLSLYVKHALLSLSLPQYLHSTQHSRLEELRHSLAEHNVTLIIEYSDTIHDREIRLVCVCTSERMRKSVCMIDRDIYGHPTFGTSVELLIFSLVKKEWVFFFLQYRKKIERELLDRYQFKSFRKILAHK